MKTKFQIQKNYMQIKIRKKTNKNDAKKVRRYVYFY